MDESRQRLVLGVDAGGTKTAAVIALAKRVRAHAEDEVTVLGRGDGGPGNPTRHGVEVAFSNVVQAIQTAGAEAAVPLSNVAHAVIGMAGAGTESMRHRAMEHLQRQTQLANLRVIPDFKLVLPAAFPAGGIAIIAGTGSIVHGVRGANETRVG
jgi:N-acetylglucosamine kinase-like BadF-type ATPase